MPNQNPKKPLGKLDAFECVKFMREEIRFQHTLLSNRISSLLASEAFLFTAFAISRGSQTSGQLVWFWHWLLPVSGAALAFLALPSVWGAIDRTSEQRELLQQYDLSGILPATDKWDRMRHSLSLAFSLICPIFIGVLWIIVWYHTIGDHGGTSPS